MNPDQTQRLLESLEKIAAGLATMDQPYTITGAADWPILAAIGGILIALVAFMWADLKSTMRDQKLDNVREHDSVWNALHDCQGDCCPPRDKR